MEARSLFGQGALRFVGGQTRRVDGQPHAANTGIGEPAVSDRCLNHVVHGGDGRLNVAHGAPGRLVADDESIRLCTVQQGQRYAGERRMKQRSLPLDHIPVLRMVVGRERLYRAGDEIRYHRIDRDP